MPESVLSGSVSSFVGAAEWHGYNLLVYASDANEIVVLDDAQILQIITPGAGDQPGSTGLAPNRAALCPQSAAIVVASAAMVMVYECTELFGQRPRWDLSIKASLDSAVASLAWLDAHRLAVAHESGEINVWDIREQRSTCTLPIGHQLLATGSDTLVTYDPDSPVIICMSVSAEGLPRENSAVALHLGSHRATRAWVVTQELVAAYCAPTDVTFIWRVDPGFHSIPELVASVPSQAGIVPDVAVTDEDGSVTVYTGSGTVRLVYGSPKPRVEMLKEADSIGVAGKIVSCTQSRVYAVIPSSLHIYSRDQELLTTITGPVGGLGATSMSFASDMLLVGSSLFSRSDLSKLWGSQRDFAQTLLIDETRMVAASSHSVGLYSIQNPSQLPEDLAADWEQPLPYFPLLLHSYNGHVFVVVQNAILKYDLSTSYLVEQYKVPFLVQIASHNGGQKATGGFIALYGSGQAQIVLLDALKPLSITWDEERGSAVSLSACDTLVALATETQITIWNVHADSLAQVCEFKVESVNQIALSLEESVGVSPVNAVSPPEGDKRAVLMLAVLADTHLRIFVVVPRIRAQPALVSMTEVAPVPLSNCRLLWLGPDQVAVFNGRQLVFVDALHYTSTSAETAKTYTLSRELGCTVPQLIGALQQPLPVYHPEILLLIFKALQPQLVTFILARLAHQMRFADIEERDDMTVVVLDPTLGSTSLSDFAGSELDGGEVPGLDLKGRRLIGLTQADQDRLQSLTDIIANRELQDLDAAASCALVLFKVFAETKEQAWAYAWLSDTKAVLGTRMNGGSPTNFHIWQDQESLAIEMEQRAKVEFAQSRDPTDVSLYYLALRKLPVLQTLWRISGGHPERDKTVKLLQNDFTTPRWRTAAQKNAYALMSRRRFLYAAAFFLLGDAITDCCQIIISKLNNMELAIGVARVYDGDTGRGVQYIYEMLGSDEGVVEDGVKWTRFWLALALGRRQQGLELLRLDTATLFMYAQQGGRFSIDDKAEWKAMLESAGVPPIVSGLVDGLEPVVIPTTSESAHSSVPNEPDTAGVEEPAESVAEETAKATPDAGQDSDWNWRPMPSHLKPPPKDIQLEPDMSAFGF